MIIRRRICQTFLCGAVAALVAAWTAMPVPAQEGGKNSAERERLTISIDDEVLTINGTKLTLPGKRADFVKVLGEPSREAKTGKDGKPLYNTLLTWDDQGILIYVRPKEDHIHAVTIALGTEKHDFWPKKNFTGKLLVDGVEIKNDSDVEQVNKAKKGKPFEQDALSKHWWIIKHADIAHYLEKRDDRGIIYVSVNVRIK